jgi:hypothetical protein
MFKLSDISVVQNIILVSVYELAIGSSLAFHLVSRACGFDRYIAEGPLDKRGHSICSGIWLYFRRPGSELIRTRVT